MELQQFMFSIENANPLLENKLNILNYYVRYQLQFRMTASFSGNIQIILGPMFSGKSSQLLRKVRRHQFAAKKCIVVNYIKDNRYAKDQCIATHDKITHRAIKADCLNKIINQLINYDVIAIDEGQFFNQISDVCQKLANFGKTVIVAALDATFERKPFGNILNLVPLCQSVIKLSAVCVFCYKQAAFTLRTVDSKEIQLIGGLQSYKPVCRKCYFQKNKSM